MDYKYQQNLAGEQRKLCKKHDAQYMAIGLDWKIGIARNFSVIQAPLNGLRHPQEGDTSG